jgi:hypothetical protein
VLGSFDVHRRVFVEVTKTENDHGGPGWEFGSCLGNPEKNKAGHDLYRLMREVATDDLVLHLLHDTWGPGEKEHRFIGRSYAANPVEIREQGPPSPGEWAGQSPYYRVRLRDYQPFLEPISLAAFIPLYDSELRGDLASKPRNYPFILYKNEQEIRLRQGGYINFCTPRLFEALKTAIDDGSASDNLPGGPSKGTRASADREFKETKRLASERYAFARNPGLIREARALRGFECEACDFDFEATYGAVGKEYIECHHVDPLCARDNPTTTTTVRDVRMLCANCHPMVHRRRPNPIPVEELRAALGLAPRPAIEGLG